MVGCREEKERKKSKGVKTQHQLVFTQPLSENQKVVLHHYRSGRNLVLLGCPKTGKTFFAYYLGLTGLCQTNQIERMIVIRSSVPTREIGFLGGKTEFEKMAVYERPYRDMAQSLFSSVTAYDVMKKSGKIIFMSSSFLRGITWNNSFVLIDECQNFTKHELHTVLTRVGNQCRVVLTGDFDQTDLVGSKNGSGLSEILPILRKMPSFSVVEFGIDDIVGSDFVKEYMMARRECLV